MQRFQLVSLMLVAAALPAIPVSAQTPPGTAATPPVYRSAFDDYRPFRDQPVASWHESNHEVARVGGHAGAIRGDGSVPASPKAMPPAPAPQPAAQARKDASAGAPTAPAAPSPHSHH
jgi:hypothetical protein